MAGGQSLLLPAAFHPQNAILTQLPAELQGLIFQRFAEVANGKFPKGLPGVEFAGQQIRHPLQVTAVVHMAVAVQIAEADGAHLAVIQYLGSERSRGCQLVAPQGSFHQNTAFSRQDHCPAFRVHNDPETDDPEAFCPVCIVGYGGSGVSHPVFGKEDFEHGTGINDGTFGYDFTYLYEIDLYVREENNSLYVNNDEHFLDYKILDSKSLKDDKVEVTVAIAYVHKFDQKVIYTSDSKGNEVVFETTPTKYGIPDDKEDKFQKYTVTFKTDKNNKTYSFENIKKVK